MKNAIGKLSSLVKRGKQIKKGGIKLPIAMLLLAMLVVGGGIGYKAWAETQPTVSVSPGAVDVGQTTDLGFTVNGNEGDSLISIQIDYSSTEFSDPADIVCPTDFKTKVIDKTNDLVKCAMGIGVPIDSGTVILKGVSSQNIGNQGFSIETIDVNGDGSSLLALVTVKNLSATAVVASTTTNTEQTRDYTFTVTNNGGDGSDTIKEVNIDIPTGFTNISVVNPTGWTCSYASPAITCVAASGSELADGSSLLISSTATAPATTGATTWNVGVTGSLGGGMNPTTQPTITVQAPPSIEEISTTISPATVSQGQAGVSFSVNVKNTGEVDVVLDTGSTISFTDGTIIYSATLSSATTIAGGATGILIFAGSDINVGMINDVYDPILTLSGTDANIDGFNQTIDTESNQITVQTPASLSVEDISSDVLAISKQSGAVNTATVSIPVTNSGEATAVISGVAVQVFQTTTLNDISGDFTINRTDVVGNNINGNKTLTYAIAPISSETYEGLVNVDVTIDYKDENTGDPLLSVSGSEVGIFEVDNTSPSITNAAITPASPINTNTPTVAFNISDGGVGIDWSTVKINNVLIDISECTSADNVYSCSHTFSALTDGTYTFTLSASDNVGNSASDSSLAGYVIDTVNPNTADDYGDKDGNWQKIDQTITLVLSDPVSADGTPSSGIAWTKYCLVDSCDPASGTDYDVSNKPTISAEGTTYFRYASKDLAGNVQDTVSKVVMIDKQAPITSSIESPTTGSYIKGTVAITATAVDNTNGSGIAKVEFYQGSTLIGTDSNNTDSTYSVDWNTMSVLDNAVYSLTAVAIDQAGNPLTSSAVSVTVDNTAPTIEIYTISNPEFSPNNDTIKDTTTIDLKFSETVDYDIKIKSGATTVKTWDGTALDPVSKTWNGDGNTGNGVYTIEITMTDKAGTVVPDTSETIILDMQDPSIESVMPANNSYVQTATPEISAILSDTLSGIDNTMIVMTVDLVVISSPSYDSATGKVSYTPVASLAEDNHDVTVSVSDNAGNVHSSSWSFIVDTKDPVTTLTVADPDGNNLWYITAPTITLTCADGTSGSGCAGIYYRWGSTGDYIPYDITFTASEGDNTLYYYSIDAAGNNETAQSQGFKVDLTDPVVDAGDDKIANALFTQDATVTETGSLVATYAWTQVGGNNEVIFRTATDEDTTISVDSASPDGTYTIRLTVTDSAGNSNYDEMTLVWDTTDPTAVITSPTTDQVVKNESGNVSLEFISTGGSVCEYSVDGGSYVDLGGCTSPQIITLADGRRTVTLKVTDTAENFATNSVEFVMDTNDTLIVSATGTDFTTIQAAINAATSGDTIDVAAGTYDEVGQIVIDKNLTITGAGKTTTIVTPNTPTGLTIYTDEAAWFRIPSGVSATIKNLTLNGAGQTVNTAIQSRGNVIVEDCVIKNIKSAQYYGFGVQFLSGITNQITRCEFSNIERVGVHVRGNKNGTTEPVATITDSTYAGKGVGTHLDYGIEFGGGGTGTVDGFNVSECTGVATVDGSTSAGIYATDYWGLGTMATVQNSTMTGNYAGIAVGYDSKDVTPVIAHQNTFSGNTYGIENVGMTEVNATANWWGEVSGPYHDATNLIGLGDAVSDNIDFRPWYTNSNLTGLDTTDPTVEITSTETSPTNASSIPITITFNEAVSDLTEAEIIVTGGAKGTLSGSGKNYTINVTPLPDAEGTMTVNIAANVAWDLAGNYNTAVLEFTINYDSVAPTLTAVSIASSNADTSLAKVGDTITIKFTSSEKLADDTVVVTYGKEADGFINYVKDTGNSSGNNYVFTGVTKIGDIEGVIKFEIDFTDEAGNSGTQVVATTDSTSVIFDKTAPATSLIIDPATPDGENDWYITAPAITLTCADQDGLSGCDKIYYRWDDGADNEYSGAITAIEGIHTLYYYSTDKAGNDEKPLVLAELKVDTVDPEVTLLSTFFSQLFAGGLVGGNDYSINWVANDANFGDTPIKLEYSVDNENSWNVIIGNTENDGEYMWTVPSNINSSYCYIRITATDLAANSEEDQNDRPFTIFYSADSAEPTVTLNSPNGGEDLKAGSDYVITWTASDNTTLANDLEVKLEYSLDGSATWNSIIGNTENDGVYIWTTPAGENSDNCLVRVSIEDASNNTGSDISNSVFSIAEVMAVPESICTDSGNGQWTCNIELTTGWNLISSPVVISENIATALSDIIGNADVIQYYNSGTWLYYDPDTATGNTLTTFEDGKGYWVYMNNPDTLTLTGLADPAVNEGSLIPSTYNINSNDWNLIGFRSVNDMIVSDYINSYTNSSASDYIMWKFNNGTSLEYLSKTDRMKPGYGYWFREK